MRLKIDTTAPLEFSLNQDPVTTIHLPSQVLLVELDDNWIEEQVKTPLNTHQTPKNNLSFFQQVFSRAATKSPYFKDESDIERFKNYKELVGNNSKLAFLLNVFTIRKLSVSINNLVSFTHPVSCDFSISQNIDCFRDYYALKELADNSRSIVDFKHSLFPVVYQFNNLVAFVYPNQDVRLFEHRLDTIGSLTKRQKNHLKQALLVYAVHYISKTHSFEGMQDNGSPLIDISSPIKRLYRLVFQPLGAKHPADLLRFNNAYPNTDSYLLDVASEKIPDVASTVPFALFAHSLDSNRLSQYMNDYYAYRDKFKIIVVPTKELDISNVLNKFISALAIPTEISLSNPDNCSIAFEKTTSNEIATSIEAKLACIRLYFEPDFTADANCPHWVLALADRYFNGCHTVSLSLIAKLGIIDSGKLKKTS